MPLLMLPLHFSHAMPCRYAIDARHATVGDATATLFRCRRYAPRYYCHADDYYAIALRFAMLMLLRAFYSCCC